MKALSLVTLCGPLLLLLPVAAAEELLTSNSTSSQASLRKADFTPELPTATPVAELPPTVAPQGTSAGVPQVFGEPGIYEAVMA
ncbi:MAG TPA: hypothetical protein VK956_05420, partial [Verrucomicrobium sp.]|nr:hypothetical protein [Verrucomicrobium sp.]